MEGQDEAEQGCLKQSRRLAGKGRCVSPVRLGKRQAADGGEAGLAAFRRRQYFSRVSGAGAAAAVG